MCNTSVNLNFHKISFSGLNNLCAIQILQVEEATERMKIWTGQDMSSDKVEM